MIPLLLTILCSSSIALIIKHSDSEKGNPLILLNGNYLICSLISLFLLFTDNQAAVSIETLLFGAALAVTFVAGFFAFTKSVNVAGTALAVVGTRLSVVIPIIFSIIIFNEMPNCYHAIGFLFTLITIIYFSFSLSKISAGRLRLIDFIYLFGVLIAIGINDFCMKVFNQWRPTSEKPFFLFSLFSFCFLYTVLIILLTKTRFEKPTFKRGLILGVPNMFSSFFLLSALIQLPAIIVYPITNIGIILLSTMGAAIIWKEKLNKYGRLALIAGSIAIVLLSL
ncbi:MAG: hypothetical protein A2V66_08795 [Ignavibacteria bacterium RBG_13_36_8]|nr:MAG: hypothetical protein A2V66_08795 [Ignavibacteria bacterium RBG_13_36_8]